MRLIYLPEAAKQFEKLDKPVQKQIKKYMDKVEKLKDPRSRGKALVANLAGLWRYRVGDYRIICRIQDQECIIFALQVDHRSEVYK